MQKRKQVNRTDEQIKDVFRSKTLKIFLTVMFVMLCGIPSLCMCLGLLGIGPLTSFINSLLNGI